MNLFDEQLELEREMVDSGVSRYWRDVNKLKEKNNEGSTAYGLLLMKSTVDKVADHLNKELLKVMGGKARSKASAYMYLSCLDIHVCSYIGLRIVINSLSNQKSSLTRICKDIGEAIHDQYVIDAFEKKNKLWYKSTKSHAIRRTCNRQHQKMALLTAAGKAGAEYDQWGKQAHYHIGSKVVDAIIQSTGIVSLVKVRLPNGPKTKHVLRAAPETLEWVNKVNESGESLAPEALPFLVPPKPWLSVNRGVAHSQHFVQKFKLIKTRNNNLIEELSGDPSLKPTIDAVNTLMATPFKINKKIIEIQKACWDSGQAWKDIPPKEDYPLPPSPFPNIPTRELTEDQLVVLRKFKHQRVEIYTKNAQLASKRFAFVKSLKTATRFSKYERIYFPWQLDFRGRAYPWVTYLSPQGSKNIKAMLLFANGKPLGDTGARWLAIHGSNCWGEDKVSFDDRVKYIDNMEEEIKAYASDPLEHKGWQQADDPWNFLAFCFEWSEYLEQGPSFVSHISVALDGSNNGLQHFSAIMRDPEGSRATNIIPQEVPEDIYKDVARIVQNKLQQEETAHPYAQRWLDFGVSRSLTKRPTMVLVYGATLFSCRDYVQEYVDEQLEAGVYNPFANHDELKLAIMYLAKMVWSSIGDCVTKAKECMSWIQAVARLVAKENLPMIWTTPSGFRVFQQYPNYKVMRIQTHIDGSILRPRDKMPNYNKIDKHRNANGASPNFVHSMDSSAMMLCILQAREEGITDYWMIHDSFGTHACNAGKLQDAIRTSFYQMYNEHDVLDQFRNAALEVVDEVPEPPARGDLDLSAVLKSDYFFA